MPFTPAERPLAGIKVIDMAHVLAGPVTSRIMAEQGAKVLHVNAPQQPDPVHTVIDTGFGKRSAFIDMDRSAGRRHAQRSDARAPTCSRIRGVRARSTVAASLPPNSPGSVPA